MGAKNIVGV